LQIRGVSLSGRVQEVTSLVKTLAFAALIAACFIFGRAASGAIPVPSHALPVAVILALQAVIFTYDGWTGVIYFSEEVKDPARELPRSLFLGVALIAGIYLMTNVALLHVASLKDLSGATMAVGVAAGKVFGALGDPLVRWLTVLSMIAAINAYHLMSTRVLFGMARDRLFFRKAMEVNRGGTPVPALLVSTAVAVAFILSGTFEQVVAVLSFFFVANYTVSFVSLFVLRRREPSAERPFKVPLYPLLPAVTLLGSLAFLGGSILGDPRDSFFALLLLIATVPLFLLLRQRRSPQS
jgi:APA family basic amino acid/polyamine antiporter